MFATYLVAFGAMAFAALSAFTLISTVRRFDPPEDRREAEKPQRAAA